MLNIEDIELLQNNIPKSIQLKTLTQEQLDVIYKNNWFNIWAPSELHGENLTLERGIKLLTELASIDGGLAWTVTLCSGANMFSGFLENSFAKSIFSNAKVCLGGSGQTSGIAFWNGEKYILNGFWKYATGTPHLTHFTLNAEIHDEKGPVKGSDGNTQVRSFVIPKDQVKVHYDWSTFGLEATASHNFSLKDCIAFQEQTFDLQSPNHSNSLYKIPFMCFAELTLLANYLGMGKRFLELMKSILDSKYDSLNDKKKIIAKYIDYNNKALDQLMQHSSLVQNQVEQQGNVDEILLNKISEQSRKLVQELKLNIVSIYSWSGIYGASTDSEINIVFRNFFTASQHALLNN